MKFKHFIVFLLLNFWPILFGIGILATLFLLNVLIAQLPKDRLFCLLMFFAVFLIPFGLIYLCYCLCAKLTSWFKKGIVIYLFWLTLGFMGTYLAAASIAGASMAVADGVAKGRDLLFQEINFAGMLLLFAQILIIPWVIISIIIMKKNKYNFFGV
ncbi:MAG: hypothetical protein M0R20_01915 [Candidatus Omnitrophica bacterium]|jgi:hypothetical protein|nr:hypothetical protein [Candidatus Omnitrophota bacterium]